MTQGCIAARGNSCRGSSVVVGMAESMVVVLRLDDALTLNELKQWPPDLHALSLFLLHDDGMHDAMDGCALELLRNLC